MFTLASCRRNAQFHDTLSPYARPYRLSVWNHALQLVLLPVARHRAETGSPNSCFGAVSHHSARVHGIATRTSSLYRAMKSRFSCRSAPNRDLWMIRLSGVFVDDSAPKPSAPNCRTFSTLSAEIVSLIRIENWVLHDHAISSNITFAENTGC